MPIPRRSDHYYGAGHYYNAGDTIVSASAKPKPNDRLVQVEDITPEKIVKAQRNMAVLAVELGRSADDLRVVIEALGIPFRNGKVPAEEPETTRVESTTVKTVSQPRRCGHKKCSSCHACACQGIIVRKSRDGDLCKGCRRKIRVEKELEELNANVLPFERKYGQAATSAS